MKNQIIVAMDNEIKDGLELMEKTRDCNEVYGYKIGSLWVLEKGVSILQHIKEHFNDTKIILDMQKWGTDNPDTIKKQVEKVAPYIDELITCPIGAGRQSLKAVTNACHSNSVKPICVFELKHFESDRYLAADYTSILLEDAFECGLRSFVVTATREVKETTKSQFEFYYGKYKSEKYADGFKARSGQTKPMIDFGVTKFIVGRAIYEASEPLQAINEIYHEINS